jgi:hypothetical protein
MAPPTNRVRKAGITLMAGDTENLSLRLLRETRAAQYRWSRKSARPCLQHMPEQVWNARMAGQDEQVQQ